MPIAYHWGVLCQNIINIGNVLRTIMRKWTFWGVFRGLKPHFTHDNAYFTTDSEAKRLLPSPKSRQPCVSPDHLLAGFAVDGVARGILGLSLD
jgi:hypothetical protein